MEFESLIFDIDGTLWDSRALVAIGYNIQLEREGLGHLATNADVLKTLTPREEKVLRLRFGLEDGRPRTLEEVGKEFNVTRERIRQIEAKALRKLRHPSRSRKLRDFLD